MRFTRYLAPLALACALVVPTTLSAQQGNGLVLDSSVAVERSVTAADGTVSTTYEKPDVVVPGDRVRITLNYHNRGTAPATNVTLRNPIPDGLQFDGTNDLGGLVLSVDGGTNWAALAQLTLTSADGTTRPAAMADITHVMWTLEQPVAPGARGSVSFFTRVR